MHSETHLALHHIRDTELRAQAEAHRLAASVGHTRTLRVRLGWTFVEFGLRLAAAPRAAATVS
ncbi:hypothetical protein JL475_26355 [Streptomyces sp. M2CJ-2]|uniref:hypothetical protein n=1 Tax=Streptomyces sp. M2CJ-2 TaxID=2803948 RepID=UPI0019273F0A|nr:hypothetical protein [Streptomyces sp. M2CJ-2]MBL3669443.1 hypothetical protein [Streptomyces sp. M2CJ-2]